MSTSKTIAIVGLAIAASTTVGAQRSTIARVDRPQPALRFVEVWRPPTSTGETRIIGTVVDVRQIPIPSARVQLRNLVSGDVEQESQTNENGEYVFLLSEPGTYVVEMVVSDGHVVALSNAGSLARYQTLQTLVQLRGRWNTSSNTFDAPQNIASYVGISAAATMTADTLLIASQQNVPPIDAGEPVSP